MSKQKHYIFKTTVQREFARFQEARRGSIQSRAESHYWIINKPKVGGNNAHRGQRKLLLRAQAAQGGN
jgi:hypothetical protein